MRHLTIVVVDVVLLAGAVGSLVYGYSARIAEDVARSRDLRQRVLLERERARMVRRVEWGPDA